MESEFKVGDQVMLKSGGPLMTVDKVGLRWPMSDASLATAINVPRGEAIRCVWFACETFYEAVLYPASIQLVKPPTFATDAGEKITAIQEVCDEFIAKNTWTT